MTVKEIADKLIDDMGIHVPEDYDHDRDGEYTCPYDGTDSDGYQEVWLCVPCFRDRIAEEISKAVDEAYQRGVRDCRDATEAKQ